MKFSKEFLIDLLDESIIKDEITDHDRWTVTYKRIFRHEGKFYLTHYSIGATEMQEQSMYEYEPDEIECPGDNVFGVVLLLGI